MKTKNIFLFLVLTISISSNTFVRADYFENGRLKSIEDKINKSNQNAEVKRNALIAGAFLTGVTVLGGGAYYLKRESDDISKREDKVKLQESDYVRLKDIEKSKNLDIEGLNKKLAFNVVKFLEIINREKANGEKLDELTLEEFIEKQQSSGNVDPKKVNSDDIAKMVRLADGGLDMILTESPNDIKRVNDAISNWEKNINRAKIIKYYLEGKFPDLNVPQPPVVVVGEPEKEQQLPAQAAPEAAEVPKD